MSDSDMWEALVEADRYDELDQLNMTEVFNYENKWPGSCLHHAAMYGRIDLVRLLICAGDDVNRVNEQGWTALHFACDCDEAGIASVLINSGANVNAQTSSGRTPLHSVRTSSLDIIRLLLESGADINLSDEFGATALYNAVLNDDWPRVGLLLEFNPLTSAGINPLLPELYNIMLPYEDDMYEPFWRLAKACGKTSININGFKITIEEVKDEK